MLKGLPSTDWIPPLLKYYDRFGYKQIMEFLRLLDNKFSADWICQYTPTTRIENMNKIIRVVEEASQPGEVIASDCFDFDKESFLRQIDSMVYGRRFTRYILLKLDYIYQDQTQTMSIEFLSVEHILPQSPKDDSQWKKDFTDEQREEWTDRLGNLVLISKRKNASQGRLDYVDKKKKYFEKRINSCPNSAHVLNEYTKWTPVELQDNHRTVIERLKEYYQI